MGFQLTPVMADGSLDTSGDFHGGPHPAEEDTLFKMACENRDGGNKLVKEGQHEAAVARYSEQIMQLRALEEEVGIEWTDAGHQAVHELRATAYLNLSLCFLKTQQWTHASNTATRAMQGDKDPPDPKQDVLPAEKKAKALFRRAQAQSEGFGNYDKAKADLEKALEFVPEDKGVQQELRKIQQTLTKSVKESDKKLAGFLSGSKKAQSGEGIFDDKLRPTEEDLKAKPLPQEPKKLSDGLWIVPKDEAEAKAEQETAEGEETVDYEELAREIKEIREEKPEVFREMRDKVKGYLEQEAAAQKEESKAEATAAGA